MFKHVDVAFDKSITLIEEVGVNPLNGLEERSSFITSATAGLGRLPSQKSHPTLLGNHVLSGAKSGSRLSRVHVSSTASKKAN